MPEQTITIKRVYERQFNVITCFDKGNLTEELFTLRLPTEEEAQMVMEDLDENSIS